MSEGGDAMTGDLGGCRCLYLKSPVCIIITTCSIIITYLYYYYLLGLDMTDMTRVHTKGEPVDE